MSTMVDHEILRDFSVLGAQACAERGMLEAWVHAYLSGGAWANPALSDGLRLKERFWVGPVEVRLRDIDRHCGPELGITHWEPRDQWERRLAELQASIGDVMELPPLIVTAYGGLLRNRDGTHRFLTADGTHRLEALKRMGRETFHVLIWFETETQREEYLRERRERSG
ncbi:MAG TPA: ParB/RepB/Spo0J family partition protein [Longimicrobium sp.]|jgi:hypothetical protein